MTLTGALAPFTSSSSRSKGERYFHSHAVVHFDPQQSMVYAVVSGTDDYVVRIELAGSTVRGTCTCPFFNDRLQPCKHLWAVALTCDARRVVQLPDSIRSDETRFVPAPLDEQAPSIWSADDPEFATPFRARGGTRIDRPPSSRRPATAIPPWQQALLAIAAEAGAVGEQSEALSGRLVYVIDRAASRVESAVVVHVLRQERKQNGDWGVLKPSRLLNSQLPLLDDEDRAILEQAGGAGLASPWEWSGSEIASPFHLKGTLARRLLPAICRTGRCQLASTDVPASRPQDSPLSELSWTDEPFRCQLRILRDDGAGVYRIDGALVSDTRSIALSDVQIMTDEAIVCTSTTALRAESSGVMPWVRHLLRGPLAVPLDHAAQLAETLRASGLPRVEGLPTELQTPVVDAVPTPHLIVDTSDDPRRLQVELAFSYDGGSPQPPDRQRPAPTRDPHIFARRRPDIEQAAAQRLEQLGLTRTWLHWERRSALQVASSEMPRLVRTLVPEGWRVETSTTRYHLASEPPQIEVNSGIDWFELRANVVVNGQAVPLPRLLEAVQRRDGAIAMDDGTIGILPESWLRDLAPLALGTREGDHLRFGRSQLALLDALLASRPSVAWDEKAVALRQRLAAIDHITPLDPPATFAGRLRDYQRDALGWTAFLRELGFGGCLADDMGLGKTVVVLALLESRRAAREASGASVRPSLVVVPRSVLFNWQQEAARFAPRLRVLDFSGAARTSRVHLIGEHDLVLATYGTLRRDAVALADVEFDYIVLDEAQAIKNPRTAGAKAARLLRGEHRLALSGTPVENRLADLWSIFEFLNPGLLSGSTAFSRSFSSGSTDDLAALSRGLRPFILRRTKEQVAVELPPKTEQTIVCDLERRQRALYDELRNHYRQRLLAGSGRSWQRSKMQVLEALLRLRQAACHPALIDPAQSDQGSAKLDLLVPRLLETIDEGHKALVFSQFTSFLALLRNELDERGVDYEYLDGATRDREARVARFQSDDKCSLFLISLKAGGVGLNLTAADYVFILDPWWNPAAEAQAVDRTHRIGQERHVFAYRLIARDTVEERVLELQQRKRELADAIITADNSILAALQREDLEMLLS